MSIATGVDPGASCGLAVVSLDGSVLRLVGLASARGKAWASTMADAVAGAPSPLFIERPAEKIRRAAAMRNHNSAFGLGRRVGWVECLAHQAGKEVRLLTTAEWWRALPLRLTGKRDEDHRVHEAGGLVHGAGAWLDSVPASYRSDAAEAVLIAAAGCFILRDEQ